MSDLGVQLPAAVGPATPGTRVLRVPDDAGSQRVDRFLADVTGLSATDPRGSWTLRVALALSRLDQDRSLWH